MMIGSTKFSLFNVSDCMLIALFVPCSFSVPLGESLEHDNSHALFSLAFLLLCAIFLSNALILLYSNFSYSQYYIIVGTKRSHLGAG
jgi:hypothetical protein